MMRMALFILTLLAVTFVGSALAGPVIMLASAPENEKVTATTIRFLTDLADGDETNARLLFAGNEEQTALMEAHLACGAAENRLHQAFVERFPNATLPPMPHAAALHAVADAIPRIILVRNDTRVSFMSASRHLEPCLEQHGTQWMVTEILSEHPFMEHETTKLTALADVMLQVAQQVNNGAYTKFQAVTDDLDKRTRAALVPVSKVLAAYDFTAPTTRPVGRSTWTTPISGNDLRKLIGMQTDSEQFRSIFAQLPGVPRINLSDKSMFITSRETGISFTIAVSSRIITGIALSIASSDNTAAYNGTLPSGIDASDNRKQVQAKLGQGEVDWDGYMQGSDCYPELGMTIDYLRLRGEVAAPTTGISAIVMYASRPRDPQPTAALDFRLIIRTGPSSDEALDAAQTADAVQLCTEGKFEVVTQRYASKRFFALSPDAGSKLGADSIVGTRNGASYILLSDLTDHTVLTPRQGKPAWNVRRIGPDLYKRWGTGGVDRVRS